ncbi:MAG: helix-turn-helix transcriptional regulator [Thermoanaerobaculia bacterium]|nr:helix-turn-helix transcriptional regulator [Thermoanaerobaculia bacterium]
MVLAIVVVASVDMVADRGEGAGWLHLVMEGAIALLATTGVVFLGGRLRRLIAARRELASELSSSREAAQEWRRAAESHLAGLASAVDEQFRRWNLTDAESDVARLLLKGKGHKQIAAARGTSERTVRQQAHVVYRKAGLEDRAALAAFFLETL